MDKQLIDNQEENNQNSAEDTTPVEKKPVSSKTHEELKQIAMDLVDGKIFTDRSIDQTDSRLFASIFMPVMFGCFNDKDINTVGLVYEYLSEAGPRSINGYPIFMSLRMLNREDTQIMSEMAQKYDKLKTEFATDV